MSNNPGTIEYWAQHKPDTVALVEADQTLTFSQWNKQADRLAQGLANQGLNAGDIVAVRTQIRLEWAVISAALAKLGCRLLGTNWRLTPAELAYVLENSKAVAIICDDAEPSLLNDVLDKLSIDLAVSIDTTALGFINFGDLLVEQPTPRTSDGEPELIIYTSGTTGLPKGVPSRKARAANRQTDTKIIEEYIQDVAGARAIAGDVNTVLITLPMHHAAGPSALAGALRRGDKTVLLRRFDAEAALRLIDHHQVNDWTGVPTMYKRIFGLTEQARAQFDVSSIQRLGVGAAPVTPELKQSIDTYFGKDLVSEGYGSTETGMITHMPPGRHSEKPGSCGQAHKHVDIDIRDDQQQSLATGEVGEIWVRTPVTITGYLNEAPLDTDTLDVNGFFRTGDVGRLDDEGYLYITDRAKDMIISGGVNIYPAEIEAAIFSHDAIQDVAVIGIPNAEFGEEVKAFVELKPNRSVSEAELIEHTRNLLASYKQPRTVEVVNELPRNTMGKILKRELREPYWREKEQKV